jgi:hypothetical protein
LDDKLTKKTDKAESSRKYRRPTTATTRTLATPMMMPRGNSTFCTRSLPEADVGVRKGFSKRFL